MYLGPELVKRFVRVFELVAELADPPQEVVALGKLLRRVLRAVETAPEALDVLVQPRNKLLARKAILVFAQQREAHGTKGELGFRK